MFRLTKKRSAIVGLVASLAIAGAAFAYFTSTGSGTGQATVGSSTPFAVSVGAATGTMYPGAGSSVLSYTITNNGGGTQNLASTTAAVASSGGNITDHSSAVTGCLASWFTATNTPPTYGDIAPGGTKSGSVSVAMTNAGVSQDSCQGHTPDITVSAG